jgi:chemotaxis protein CheD
MEAEGARLERVVAKLFGGGHVLRGASIPIGAMNAEFGLAYLAARGIALEARDLGGDAGRRIAFFADTGEVRLWRVRADGPQV